MEEEEIFDILPRPTKNISAEEIQMALIELQNAGIKTFMGGYDVEALLMSVSEEGGQDELGEVYRESQERS
ncbi:MAG: hypothetical protein PHW01_02970 [Patescibacteria group bacterium]|nr:hypothetical protein [Patescibacteria group bacterium]